jgi:hypothetical protein
MDPPTRFDEWDERKKALKRVHGMNALRPPPYASSRFLDDHSSGRNLYKAWKQDQGRKSQEKEHQPLLGEPLYEAKLALRKATGDSFIVPQ